MKIKHNFKTGKTVIELSWTETRQFVSSAVACDVVAKQVSNLVSSLAPKGDNKQAITTL